MSAITTKQFNLLTDVNLAWDFLVEVYDANRVEAPYFEYAITESWMNKDYLHLCRFWLDGEKVVGFVFHENPVTSLHCALRPGYEALAEDMVAYAAGMLPASFGPPEFVFDPRQTALIAAAEKQGWALAETEKEYRLDMEAAFLDYELPEGYHFVQPDEIDALKLARCTWSGFNEWELGPFRDWDKPDSSDWNPHKAFLDVQSSMMAPPPHSTYEHNVVIANEAGEYVCYSGMWWVPENGLCYMEPLCTALQYQHKGLASAALTAHYRKFKALGGKVLTGGGSEFYRKIGYDTEAVSLTYRRA